MGFSLDLPDKTAVKTELEHSIQLAPEKETEISTTVKSNADTVFSLNLDDFAAKSEVTTAFEGFGNDVLKRSEDSSKLMKIRAADLTKVGGESAQVGNALEELSVTVRGLDPNQINMDNGIFSKIVNPVKKYFAKYKTADADIADIITELDKGSKILKDDNVTLALEQQKAKELIAAAKEKTEIAMQMDDYLTKKIEEYKTSPDYDEMREKFIQDEILFPLRQRCMDFQQIIAVEQQGYIGMEIVRKNNLELMRSVDRAKTVTVTALRTAVMVAGALYHQKLILDKVNAVTEATNSIIASTSKMLNTQGVEIQKQATTTAISIDTLKQSFAETFEAMDSINTYKQNALPQMKQTIEEFRQLAEEGQKKINQIDAGNSEIDKLKMNLSGNTEK